MSDLGRAVSAYIGGVIILAFFIGGGVFLSLFLLGYWLFQHVSISIGWL